MPSKKIQSQKTGFTIIEVVLVLAIAGLIFLMVFVALPALQRSQRDTARRSDIARVSTALTNWQTNNNNKLPDDDTYEGDEDIPDCGNDADAACFVKKYMNESGAEENAFADPDGEYYNVNIVSDIDDYEAPDELDYNIWIVKAAKCDGEEPVELENQNRKFAVLYHLEGAGIYCVDNQ